MRWKSHVRFGERARETGWPRCQHRALVRLHNKVHWVRDWNFDEARHQLRSGNSTARALASLRNLAISLLHIAGATNIAAALRWVGRDATRVALLLGV